MDSTEPQPPRVLYHLWLSPESRKVRLALSEKGLDFEMRVEKIWERRTDFLALNPAGDVPVLIEPDGLVIADSGAIIEFLEETRPDPPLLSGGPAARAEIRRLCAWFDHKFRTEVTSNLVGEKIDKRFLGLGQPSSDAIRAGLANIHYHLDYIGYLAERRNWLAGPEFSVADKGGGGSSVLRRLYRRRALGRPSRGARLVHPDQVAAELSQPSLGSHSGRATAQALRRPGFLTPRARP